MKKLRVFQNVYNKRIVPGFSLRSLGTVLLFLLLIPYLITFLWGNLKRDEDEMFRGKSLEEQLNSGRIYVVNHSSLGSERIPLEVYVADSLVRCIGEEFEQETLKAQAVLLRSSLLAEREKSGGQGDITVCDQAYGKVETTKQIREAAAQTAGIYLSWEDKPVYGAYFSVSNGATRNGSELLSEEYSYLTSVVCEKDFLSPDFSDSFTIYNGEFQRLWQQLSAISVKEEIQELEEKAESSGVEDYKLVRDSAGYVLYVKGPDKWVSGETFRSGFLLTSSCFRLEQEQQQITIIVKGSGHGLGMSQYGANEMAKEGKNYIEILNYFFSDATITKTE